MTRIRYIDPRGAVHDVDVKDGLSVMEGARAHDIEGIVAECGGCSTCSTCHVHVDAAWYERLPPPEVLEEEMIKEALGVGPTSRLSCQIEVRPELDGLIVRIPEAQR
ncbi:MAG TPA: 2Fe-2S iron-sulfur cluster-binding protein [Steroidobacteraceae bacterium]|nr:2Fe-2S iron-sulfur cluster-binding protein [Steroidobacteraceae bacterium]